MRGSLPPTKKEECEMIMMCGLPGCGKTYWATKHAQGNPEKKYTVLGTNNIIDKMKVCLFTLVANTEDMHVEIYF